MAIILGSRTPEFYRNTRGFLGQIGQCFAGTSRASAARGGCPGYRDRKCGVGRACPAPTIIVKRQMVYAAPLGLASPTIFAAGEFSSERHHHFFLFVAFCQLLALRTAIGSCGDWPAAGIVISTRPDRTLLRCCLAVTETRFSRVS